MTDCMTKHDRLLNRKAIEKISRSCYVQGSHVYAAKWKTEIGELFTNLRDRYTAASYGIIL